MTTRLLLLGFTVTAHLVSRPMAAGSPDAPDVARYLRLLGTILIKP